MPLDLGPGNHAVVPKKARDFGVASLMPAFRGVVAQWSLRGAPDIDVLYLDRSGNNNHLQNGNATPVPDQIPNQSAIFAATLGGMVNALAHQTGELTIVARAYIRQPGLTQTFFCLGSYSTGSNGLCSFYCDATNRVGYYRETGVNVGGGFVSSLVAPSGRWLFFSLRRAVSGVVTLGLSQTYETSPALAPPDARGDAPVFLGWNGDAPPGGNQWGGGLADLCIGNAALTDAELVPLYKAAMAA